MVAVGMAVTGLLALLGAAPGVKPRVAPPLFVLHALTGAVALVTGAVQLRLGCPRSPRQARADRPIGRCYVAAAWITSVAGAVTAAVFDVGVARTAVVAVWSVLWFTATTIALRRIRARRVREHRDWMIRSSGAGDATEADPPDAAALHPRPRARQPRPGPIWPPTRRGGRWPGSRGR